MSSTGAVAFAAPAASPGQAASLRGTAPVAVPAAPAEARAGASTAPWLLGAAAVAAASVAGSGGRRPARSTRRALPAAAAAAAGGAAVPVAAPAEAAPPPPPFDPAKEVGVTAPLGYFDPLGFCQVGDYEGFHKLRSAEIKHGRVAMLAALGTVVQHFVRLPGCETTPAGIKALWNGDGILGLFIYVLPVVAFLELFYWRDDLSREPGNFGDPANWAELPGGFGYTEEVRNKEINNGRMAMISILGIIVAEIATGKDGVQQFGL